MTYSKFLALGTIAAGLVFSGTTAQAQERYGDRYSNRYADRYSDRQHLNRSPDDVVERPVIPNAKPILWSFPAPETLDSRATDLGGLVAQMRFERVADDCPIPSAEPSKILECFGARTISYLILAIL